MKQIFLWKHLNYELGVDGVTKNIKEFHRKGLTSISH